MPWDLYAMKLLKDDPQIPFPVHLRTISECVEYQWKPLSDPVEVLCFWMSQGTSIATIVFLR